jgi:hypothetical protein
MKNKNLLMTAIAIFAFATITNAQVPSYVSTNGLVGWWPFNGNANDESGNGINGNPIGAVLTTDRFGNQNSAYSFNGSSNVINCGNGTNPNLTLIGDFTFSAWINASCFGCNNYANMILSKHRAGSPNGYVFGFWNGGMINYQGTPNFDASTYPAGQSGYIDINVWKNVIVVYESASTSLKYYIDGNLVDNKLLGFNMASNIDDLVFGAQRNGAATGYLDYFSGKIDDIGIWNVVLTQQEITNLYNSQTCTATINTSGSTTFCQGGSVVLNANSGSGLTYQWRNNGNNISGATNGSYTANAAGSYTVIVTNSSGCTATSSVTAVIVNTTPAAPLGSTTQTFCNSATVNDLVASGSTIQWYDSQSGGSPLTPTTNLLNNNTYYASQTISGCESASLLAVNVVINSVTDITTSLSGITISSNNTLASYVWLDCGDNFSILSGETSQNFTPTVNGSYSVQLTENGCVDTSLCVTISSVSLFENTFMDNLKVYPNPNSGNFTVDIGQVTDKVDVTVLDLQGRIVLRKEFTQTQLFQMNLNDSAGIYIVSIASEHGNSLVRIVKN